MISAKDALPVLKDKTCFSVWPDFGYRTCGKVTASGSRLKH